MAMNLKTMIAAAIAAAFALPLQAADDKASSGSAATSGSAAGATQSGAEKMFRDLDKDKDGFISRAEAKGSPHEKDFDKLDKNADGKLSREEHAAAHGEKAGAGATSSSERTAEPQQPSSTSAPTGEKKY
jgi:hypothetical protein